MAKKDRNAKKPQPETERGKNMDAEPKNKKRNTYRVDETLEEPFSLKHLKRAWIYIRKYKVKMTSL